MTLVATECQPTRPPWDGIRELATPDGVQALHMTLNRAVTATTRGDSPLLSRIITESVDAFAEYGGDPELAATRVAPLLWRVGDQHARNGFDADYLGESFRRTQVAAQRGLQLVVGPTLTSEVMNHLLQDVTAFIQQLHREARIGWERTHAILIMTDDERRHRLTSALLEPSDISMLDTLAEFAQIDLAAPYIIVVSASGELPRTLLDLPHTLSGDSLFEALVPASWSQSRLAEHIESPFATKSPQVVVGPSIALADIADTAGPTRRGAELLREGLVADLRTLVPCTDLLGSLVIDGNPKLTKLIVAKHLGPLESMTPCRRLATGELLVQWLESGLSVRQIADALGIPAQTAYSRMKNIRELFGDAIDDLTQRLELIIALQATLPRWRVEARGISSPAD